MKLNDCFKVLSCLVAASLLLAGCALEPSRSGSSKEQNVVVNSDVQRDFDKAVAALKRKEYDNAIALLNSVIEREQRLTAPYVNLAMAYRDKGDDTRAEEYLKKALGIDLASPIANNELGLLYRKLGRFAEAKKAYTNALTEYPDYLPVIKNLGILCDLYMQDLECALKQFEIYQQQVPDDKIVTIWIAEIKGRMGR